MSNILSHVLHAEGTSASLHRVWQLATDTQSILVAAAAGGSVSAAIPPLVALAIKTACHRGQQPFRFPQ